MAKLTRAFYHRDTCVVARELLGMELVRVLDGEELVCRITETEAYIGRMDKACHAYGGRRTARTETMFGPPGHAYVYLIYGMYHCLNLVTEGEGAASAVLIRKMEPVSGLETMARLRFGAAWETLPPAKRRILGDGPGKLCRALAITRGENGLDLCGGTLYLREPAVPEQRPIQCGTRIGIDYAEEARDFPWRFYVN